VTEVDFHKHGLERFRPVADTQRFNGAAELAVVMRRQLKGRTLWNINSTAAGGGVAEMLASLLPYVRGIGVDARWAVIQGTPDFFRVTKRLHNALHGVRGDGSELGSEARAIYDATMQANAAAFTKAIRPHDVVVLHDPQTAGLASSLMDLGALVIWRCHIGHDSRNDEVDRGWAFLAPYLEKVPAFVFSRQAYAPAYCDRGRTTVITPSIDAFSAKNQDMDEETVRAILVHVGLVDGPQGPGKPTFVRQDGTPGQVDRRADVMRHGRASLWEAPLVVQVSRWDHLKDPVGVLRGFARFVEGGHAGKAELVLAGPNVRAVADDPEGAEVFDAVAEAWRALGPEIRDRIHLASLPMADLEENAAIVNALQRHAAVVVQKSLHEGFGLTVTEAMWKARPVIASAVGGIQDQIVDGEHGLLLRDPEDLDAFAEALGRVLSDPELATRIATNAQERVREEFLGLGHLLKYAELILRLDRSAPPGAAG
jgi:trehalose synthase